MQDRYYLVANKQFGRGFSPVAKNLSKMISVEVVERSLLGDIIYTVAGQRGRGQGAGTWRSEDVRRGRRWRRINKLTHIMNP